VVIAISRSRRWKATRYTYTCTYVINIRFMHGRRVVIGFTRIASEPHLPPSPQTPRSRTSSQNIIIIVAHLMSTCRMI